MTDCAKQNVFMFHPPKVQVWFTGSFLKELSDLFKNMDVEVYFMGETNEYSDICCSMPSIETPLNIVEHEESSPRKCDDLTHHVDCSSRLIHLSGDISLCSVPPDAVLNLDVSTMIAHVSNLTNGYAKKFLMEPILVEQASREQISPVRDVLDNLFAGRKLMCCRTAFLDFKKIVSCVGGPKEKERTEKFLVQLKAIPDSPSERTLMLQESSKIKPRSKIIFGTGDYLKAITVTANYGFLRAAEGQGIKFAAIFHESRALSEMKESFE